MNKRKKRRKPFGLIPNAILGFIQSFHTAVLRDKAVWFANAIIRGYRNPAGYTLLTAEYLNTGLHCKERVKIEKAFVHAGLLEIKNWSTGYYDEKTGVDYKSHPKRFKWTDKAGDRFDYVWVYQDRRFSNKIKSSRQKHSKPPAKITCSNRDPMPAWIDDVTAGWKRAQQQVSFNLSELDFQIAGQQYIDRKDKEEGKRPDNAECIVNQLKQEVSAVESGQRDEIDFSNATWRSPSVPSSIRRELREKMLLGGEKTAHMDSPNSQLTQLANLLESLPCNSMPIKDLQSTLGANSDSECSTYPPPLPILYSNGREGTAPADLFIPTVSTCSSLPITSSSTCSTDSSLPSINNLSVDKIKVEQLQPRDLTISTSSPGELTSSRAEGKAGRAAGAPISKFGVRSSMFNVPVDHDQLAHFHSVCEKGSHDWMAEACELPRDEVKDLTWEMLYGKNDRSKSNMVAATFNYYWPSIYRWIINFKREHSRHPQFTKLDKEGRKVAAGVLSILLSRAEACMVMGEIYREITRQLPGVPVLTCHDSYICPVSARERVMAIVKAGYKRHGYDIEPSVTVEGREVKGEAARPASKVIQPPKRKKVSYDTLVRRLRLKSARYRDNIMARVHHSLWPESWKGQQGQGGQEQKQEQVTIEAAAPVIPISECTTPF